MNENNKIQQENISRVLLVGVNVDDNPDFETSMEELESLAEAWKQRKSGACRLPECQYINGLKKVLCKTSQYGSYLIFDVLERV